MKKLFIIFFAVLTFSCASAEIIEETITDEPKPVAETVADAVYVGFDFWDMFNLFSIFN